MKKVELRVFLFVVASLVTRVCLGSPTKIELTTQYHDGVIPNAFNIRCAPQTHGNCAKTIISMQVTKDDHKIIANIREGDVISYHRLLRSSVTAEGHIDQHINRTFLSVTINEAVREDSGFYTCTILYLDESLRLTTDSSGMNVSITNHDTQDIIKHLISKNSFLENLVKFQQDEVDNIKISNMDLIQRMSRLEQAATPEDCNAKISQLTNQLNVLERGLKRLNDQVDTTVSFLALRPEGGVFQTGQDCIYSNVIKNEGGGYNGTTGVFTAPFGGYYLLSMSLTAHHNVYMYLDLKSSTGQVLTSMLVGDQNGWSDYVASSCVVKLDAGEQVRPVIKDASPRFRLRFNNNQDHMHKFYGYLLKAV